MKFSIIVPVYNGEKYIIKNLNSLKNQKYKDFEIIIINDGSTDKTDEVLDDFFRQNQNLKYKIIKIENSGLANARNVGIENATGSYFCNLDADDYIDEDTLLEIHKKGEFDICYYGWYSINEKYEKIGVYSKKFNFTNGIIDGQEAAIKKLKRDIWICQGNAFYNKEFIDKNKIRNIKGINQGEDLRFITLALLNAKIVKSISKNLFYCLERESSMMRADINKTHFEVFKAIEDIRKNINLINIDDKKRKQLLKLVDIEYINNLLNVNKKIIISSNIELNKKKEIMKQIKEQYNNYRYHYKQMKFKKNIEYIIWRFNPGMYSFITKRKMVRK